MYNAFLSYAHEDNKQLLDTEPGKGWISSFALALKNRYSASVGRSEDVNIWWDRSHLKGHHDLDDSIKQSISNTQSFVVFLSSAYLASDWCRKELNHFLNTHSDNIKNKIFVIELDEIPSEKKPSIPDAISALKGYRAYNITEDNRSRRFGGYVPKSEDENFANLVTDIASDMVSLFESEIRNSTSNDDKKIVFIGDVTDDLGEKRREIIGLCKDYGYEVLPKDLFPRDAVGFSKLTKECLETADLFIQILSQHPGEPAPDMPKGYIHFQYDMAQQAKSPILQWISPSLPTEEITNKEHLALVNASTARKELFEQFKLTIRQEIDKISENQKKSKDIKEDTSSTPHADQLPHFYISSDKHNMDAAGKIADKLAASNFAAFLPIESIDSIDAQLSAAEVRNDLEDNLINCDGVIILHDENNIIWVRQQMLHILRTNRKRKRKHICVGIYHNLENGTPAIGVRVPGLKFLRANGEFEISHLELCSGLKFNIGN